MRCGGAIAPPAACTSSFQGGFADPAICFKQVTGRAAASTSEGRQGLAPPIWQGREGVPTGRTVGGQHSAAVIGGLGQPQGPFFNNTASLAITVAKGLAACCSVIGMLPRAKKKYNSECSDTQVLLILRAYIK